MKKNTAEKQMDENIQIDTPEALATEMYRELKKANQFKNTVIIWLCAIIAGLVIAITGLNIYHIHKWSEFDTVVVDTGDGGNANYVQGDNQGGIFNGEGYSQETESKQGQEQRNAD